MKTVVNPTTHVHEIACLSGLINVKVDTDAETEVNGKFMRRYTFVRPLGQSFGESYPWTAFPHDMDAAAKKSVLAKAFPNERALLSNFFARIGHTT
jgi:hypothetical protein